jgi:hypothetical protein
VAELVTVIVLVVVLPRYRSTRLWAAAFAVPAVWVAPHVLDLPHRFG